MSGSTPKTKTEEFWDGDIDRITPAELNENTYIITESKRKITQLGVDETGLKPLPKGTVILSSRAPIGKVAIAGKQLYCNQGFKNLICSQQIENTYLYWFLKSKNEYLNSLGRGATFKEISKNIVENIEIELPDINEQKLKAEKLRKCWRLISLRKAQLAKLDELVKSRFVELFGDPVGNGMGWEQVALSTCLESIDNGKSFVCDVNPRQGNWPAVLKLSAVTYGFYRPKENKAMLDKSQFIEDVAVRNGDLLFTRKNTPELVGMCAYIYDTPDRLMMPDLIFRLNTTRRCNKVFIWKLINHDLFRKRMQAIATGSAKSMSNISKERLFKLKIILPPIDLQNQFAAFVQATDKSKAAIQKSLDETQLLFDSLMQKYFG